MVEWRQALARLGQGHAAACAECGWRGQAASPSWGCREVREPRGLSWSMLPPLNQAAGGFQGGLPRDSLISGMGQRSWISWCQVSSGAPAQSSPGAPPYMPSLELGGHRLPGGVSSGPTSPPFPRVSHAALSSCGRRSLWRPGKGSVGRHSRAQDSMLVVMGARGQPL